MTSGFGEEDGYNVYDKPWREGGSAANAVYKPSKNLDKDLYGDDVEKIVKTSRWGVVLWLLFAFPLLRTARRIVMCIRTFICIIHMYWLVVHALLL